MKKSTKMLIDSKTYLGLTGKDHNRSTDQLKKKVLALRNNFINYIVNLSICFKIIILETMVDSGTGSWPSEARLHYYVVFLGKTILALTRLSLASNNKQSG